MNVVNDCNTRHTSYVVFQWGSLNSELILFVLTYIFISSSFLMQFNRLKISRVIIIFHLLINFENNFLLSYVFYYCWWEAHCVSNSFLFVFQTLHFTITHLWDKIFPTHLRFLMIICLRFNIYTYSWKHLV